MNTYRVRQRQRDLREFDLDDLAGRISNFEAMRLDLALDAVLKAYDRKPRNLVETNDFSTRPVREIVPHHVDEKHDFSAWPQLDVVRRSTG